jgi:hypothetical protein
MTPALTRATSDQLVAAAIALYSVVVLIGFVILIVRAVPESSVPTLAALAGFLGSVATSLMALAEWVARKTESTSGDEGDRL